jgi:DNA-binding CsgD family transcriptional regulator
MTALPWAPLTPPECRLVGLLARGQTPAQASETLHISPAEAEAMLADLLRRQGLSARHQLLARALIYRWI